MIDNLKVLILYILRDIEIIDIKKIIWEKLQDYEEEELLNSIKKLCIYYEHQYYLDSDGYYTD